MPQDDPNHESPWLRDDWIGERAVADVAAFAAGASDGDHEDTHGGEDDASTTPDRSTLRAVVAASLGIVLVASAAVLLLRDDGEPVATPVTVGAFEGAPDPGPSGLGQPGPTVEDAEGTATTGSSTGPSTASVAPSVDAGASDSTPVIDPVMPTIVVGQPPAWAERTVAVPVELAALAPTEAITLTSSGVVNVTEFPSGRTRSIDVSSSLIEPQLAFGDGTIVAFDSTGLLLIEDGQPVVEASLSDGIIFVQPWTGTGNFIVTSPSTGPERPQREWVLRGDGTLDPLDDRIAGESRFWSRAFAPTGDALVGGPGGVYAIDPTGVARRLSTGDLLATGDRHWAIEECDEALRCAYSLVDWETGEVRPGELDPIGAGGFLDPVTRISPDGRSITYRADTDGTGRRRILDVATGTSVEAGRINQLVHPDAWASDSSGLFVADRGLRFVDRATGATVEIEGLDSVRTVATGRFTAPD